MSGKRLPWTRCSNCSPIPHDAAIQPLITKPRKLPPEIEAAEFGEQYKTLNKITTAGVTTATPYERCRAARPAWLKIVASGATNENIDLQTSVDPDLIGGFTLSSTTNATTPAQHTNPINSEHSFLNLYIKEF